MRQRWIMREGSGGLMDRECEIEGAYLCTHQGNTRVHGRGRERDAAYMEVDINVAVCFHI